MNKKVRRIAQVDEIDGKIRILFLYYQDGIEIGGESYEVDELIDNREYIAPDGDQYND